MHARDMGGHGFRGRGGPGAGFCVRGPGAGYGMGGFGFGGGGIGPGAGLLAGGGRLAQELNLSDTQVKKLRNIGADRRRAMVKARADMELARMDLAELMRDDTAGTEAVERQIDTIARMQAGTWKSMAASRREALQVLTAKQREQLRNLRPMGRGWDDDRGTRRKSG
jgi:Spy/CpxP family protein refolding chaperone